VSDDPGKAFESGDVLGERYRLEEPIGAGGMGTVWRAHHLELDAPVAVKLIHAVSPRAIERFKREARAAAKLRSPHVVQVLDHGVERGQPYMVMELLEGESLADRIHAERRLRPQEVAMLFEQLSRAMARAHERGIVHRDLKPSNIQLIPDGDKVRLVVLDFGIAKVADSLDDASTRTGAILGTPFYMSPEQLSDSKNVDLHADLWAMAIIAYECVVGQRPYRGETVGAVAMKLAGAAPVPSEHGVVPVDFDAWFAKATSKKVGDRYDSASASVDALREALSSEAHDLALGDTVTAGSDEATTTPEIVQARSLLGQSSASDEGDSRWRAWAYPAAVIGVAFLVWLKTAEPPPERAPQRTVTSTSRQSSATPSDTSRAPASKSRWAAFPCESLELAEPPTCKRESYRAWCDEKHQRVACCAPGLAPLDGSGACGCPPGGTTSEEAQQAGCDKAADYDLAAFRTQVREKNGTIAACYEQALERNPKAKGTITFGVRLDLHGHVFDARIGDSSLPDSGAQRCALAAWRTIVFAPPIDGFVVITYPMIFKQSDEK
jgi:serine/threonine protein kinase